MWVDIREKPYVNHQDIAALNFFRDTGNYVFRRHYRSGLRSHILQVLKTTDVQREQAGTIIDGLRWFPRAKPSKMLRIFRLRFHSLAEAFAEIGRVKTIGDYLEPEQYARSNEFLVDYRTPYGHDVLLCGLQEFVPGEALDPWGFVHREDLADLFARMANGSHTDLEKESAKFVRTVCRNAARFIRMIKKMILEANYIPDLAGVGNLLLTPDGHIKLVDINNISKVLFDPKIRVDDRGYPVCDKSVQALALLEEKLLEKALDKESPIYRVFLEPCRLQEVSRIVLEFHQAMKAAYS
jgi:hypothetical protein